MSRHASNPALTVIMPTYNRSGYVRQCLRSLRACDLSDLEIIVADDGSTDETETVVAATDPSAKYFRQDNTGTPSTARNRGFELSTGRYVAFLDCDDEWLPNVPTRAIQLLDAYPEVDVLFAEARMGNSEEGFRSWIEMGGQDAFFELPCRQPEEGFRILERESFLRRMAVRNPVFIGAVIMRRAAFSQTGGFDPQLRGAADWELWLRMASRMTFAYLNRPLAVYTRHLDNMSSDMDGMEREFCLALKKVLAKCHWLSHAERRWLGSRLRHHLFVHGYGAYERGDYTEARARFADLLSSCGPEFRATVYWTLCALPFGMGRGLRKVKHLMSGRWYATRFATHAIPEDVK
jgi:glycosyltransferase involved in cell wall biosynthesis